MAQSLIEGRLLVKWRAFKRQQSRAGVFILLVVGGFSISRADAEPAGSGGRVAILGDSLSTGAAAHPDLVYDTKRLWRIFSGKRRLEVTAEHIPQRKALGLDDPLVGPRRLWPSSREFFGRMGWVFAHLWQGVGRAYLDTEEYSWGNMVSSSLGVKGEDVLIAAQDGARVAAMPRHWDRVFAATDRVIPANSFIFYSGNDLCGPALPYVTSADDFADSLRSGLWYMLRNGRPAPGGSDVYVLGYLSVLQLLHSEEILSKKVEAFGGELTCRELREQGYRPKEDTPPASLPPEAWYFSMFMPPNPAAFCPTLFGGHDKDGNVIGVLANRIRAYRGKQKEVVAELREQRPADVDVRFHYVEQTSSIIFDSEDIAQDCFHLSTRGQGRVAEKVLNAIGEG